jgi:protein-S-isoprenylcysteine O-methyltransferase Ste14
VFARWLIAIFTLPGTVAVLIPFGLLRLSSRVGLEPSSASPASVRFWLALTALGGGLSVGLWTMGLFGRFGRGTPAPWDPPTRLVIRGPYCHVRNPMILSVLALLLGESLLFGSWLLLCWMLLFFGANCVYFPLSEEPKLRRRFGRDYEVYCQHVRRWLPTVRPYRPTGDRSAEVG